MRIEGAIRPIGSGLGFDREEWRQLVRRRPEFRRSALRQGRNPLTGGTMTFQPQEDTAEVLLEGSPVGTVYWSMNDEPLVCVSVEQSAMPMVLEWAKELHGEFQEESWGTADPGN
jgi:hypothetical protein